MSRGPVSCWEVGQHGQLKWMELTYHNTQNCCLSVRKLLLRDQTRHIGTLLFGSKSLSKLPLVCAPSSCSFVLFVFQVIKILCCTPEETAH